MLNLCQRNPLWAKDNLGISGQTCGRMGCTTTAICDLASYFKDYVTPKQLAAQQDLYNADGKIIWANIRLTKMKFDKRVKTRNDEDIKAALADPNRAVILEVSNGSHWVAATRPTWFGKSYVAFDPWDASVIDVIKKYGNISGYATFRAA